ncbi:MAG TPA: aminomethyl-transferring glycine dehydrogenase [Acidimicrobiales bacterium]|nr:aminomethyl-transferring glycine dehydrogenase [Acidimicrobiales bacterium]
MAELMPFERFVERHLGPSPAEQEKMLSELRFATLDDLTAAAVPAAIRSSQPLDLPEAATERETTEALRELAQRNRVVPSMIGLGYHGTITPPVIQRNVLEDPGWYTAYTPYQPEISQGRLEALLNFQTMVSDLTGTELANASLLDEPTAAAEAMAMARRLAPTGASSRFVLDAGCHPHTIAVVQTRAEPLGIEVEVGDPRELLAVGDAPFGVLTQNPSTTGEVRDLRPLIDAAHERGALAVVATDLLACSLMVPPGEQGADIVVGSAQRFGVPMGFGGPHAGFVATKAINARSLPGRLVGVSRDDAGHMALRLALQTREQHIRREKATSNICTAEVLLAVVASMYAVYHGPDGLRRIARRVHAYADSLATRLRVAGLDVAHDSFFDTVTIRIPARAGDYVRRAVEQGIDIRRVDADHVAISIDESTTLGDLRTVARALGADLTDARAAGTSIPEPLRRTTTFLTHPVFNTHHSETSMLRYLRSLRDKDIALDRSMIPLGSCTMKLNATTEMAPISWPEWASMHPFAPLAQARGYLELFRDLERWLCEITGYDAVSLQPNAGSQGEYAGLLAIRAYHRSRGEDGRTVCLIPASAHGTNPASAVMAGFEVVVVACDDRGNVDLDDLRSKVATHRHRLGALMITYPSTHGVFEDAITEICDVVHDAGGQVYLDGANLNAMVGLARPGKFGADVSHLNLHKTFCIPHGGGGPGVGPIGVRAHLAPFLPNHPLVAEAGPVTGVGPIAGAPWGSALILTIPWAYIRAMGPDGLRTATQVAILNANHIARRLAPHYPILYTGASGLVAHECILDLRAITKQTGISVDDVAKRLVDYGIHAPTMSFPVAGTLMVEPTESENLAELDRFCDAMIAIREEIREVASGTLDREDNPLRNAPHTAEVVTADEWTHPYPRSRAAYPVPSLRKDKYWSPVGRVDGAQGDRNLMCSCPPLSSYE